MSPTLQLPLLSLTQTIYIQKTFHGIIASINSSFNDFVSFQTVSDLENYYIDTNTNYVLVA